MAIASVVDLDLGKAAPLLVLGALGLGAWYLIQRQQKQDAEANAAQQVNPLATYQAAADLALLQSFSGGAGVPSGTANPQGSAPGAGNTPTADPALPTYTAPSNPAAVTTTPALTAGNLNVLTVNGNGI